MASFRNGLAKKHRSLADLHRHAFRMKSALAGEPLQIFLTDLFDANIAVSDPTSLQQAFADPPGFTSQDWTIDDHASIVDMKVEHTHVPHVAAKLCADAVQQNVIGDLI